MITSRDISVRRVINGYVINADGGQRGVMIGEQVAKTPKDLADQIERWAKAVEADE